MNTATVSANILGNSQNMGRVTKFYFEVSTISGEVMSTFNRDNTCTIKTDHCNQATSTEHLYNVSKVQSSCYAKGAFRLPIKSAGLENFP